MGTATVVVVRKLTEPTELFRQYDDEHHPQPASLLLDTETGELTCRHNPSTLTPSDIFHKRTLALSIPPLTADAANQLLNDVAPLAQRVLDGATIEWDGDNYAGVLSEAAQEAFDEMRAAVNASVEGPDVPVVSAVGASSWYSDDPSDELGLTADTTDEELAAIEETAEAEIQAASSAPVVVRYLDAYLADLRDQRRAQVRENLEEVADQFAELRGTRDRLIRRIHAWGVDSDRAIGEIARMSHTNVQKIVKAGGAA